MNTPLLLTSLSTMKKSPKWTLTGRDNFEEKMSVSRSQNAPGPGAYGCPSNSKFNRASAALFGSSTREGGFTQMKKPGPGNYSPCAFNSSTICKSPDYRFGSASREGIDAATRRCRTPGPGTYEVKYIEEHLSTSLRSRSAEPRKPNTPGPGAYATPRELGGTRWRFGSEKRPALGSEGKNPKPGPGTYAIKNTVGTQNPLINAAPKYTFVPRRNPNFKNDTPGPGAHGGCYTTFG